MTEQAKRCSKCGKTKPREEFSRDRSKKDGLQARCRACAAERYRSYRAENAEKIAEYRAANRERIAEYSRAYRKANAEKIAEYRAANRERMRDYMRESLAHSRGDYRKRFRKIHGVEPEVVDDFTMADLIERWGDACWHCKVGEFEEIDHYPVSVKARGSHSLDNVKPSCHDCNQQTWREEMGEAA